MSNIAYAVISGFLPNLVRILTIPLHLGIVPDMDQSRYPPGSFLDPDKSSGKLCLDWEINVSCRAVKRLIVTLVTQLFFNRTSITVLMHIFLLR